MKELKCPHCGFIIVTGETKARDALTGESLSDYIPSDGHRSVCFQCGGFSILNDKLEMVKADPHMLNFHQQEQLAMIREHRLRNLSKHQGDRIQ